MEATGGGSYLVSGTLTFATVPRVYKETSDLFAGTTLALTLDLGAVRHTDSAGLALLVEWMRQAKQKDKTITFQNIPPQMLAIAKVSGLDTVLPLA